MGLQDYISTSVMSWPLWYIKSGETPKTPNISTNAESDLSLEISVAAYRVIHNTFSPFAFTRSSTVFNFPSSVLSLNQPRWSAIRWLMIANFVRIPLQKYQNDVRRTGFCTPGIARWRFLSYNCVLWIRGLTVYYNQSRCMWKLFAVSAQIETIVSFVAERVLAIQAMWR